MDVFGCYWLRLVCLALAVVYANPALCEEPQKVNICQLVSDRGTYNHKLIEVEGFISHGFEDFTLFDPSCTSTLDIWLEYGGTSRSGTMYCCGVTTDRTRPRPLEFEGIPVPLTDDERFKQFNRLVHRQPDSIAHATLVGRFFSGEHEEVSIGSFPRGSRWSGYGHMGCCSLLAIERVLSVDPQDRRDLDYRGFADQPDLEKVKCGNYRDLIPIEPYRLVVDAQQKAESGDHAWAFDDPERVASDTLAHLISVDANFMAGMKQKHKMAGRIVYEWRPSSKGIFYMVVVSRPYWLTFYSQDPTRIVWSVVAAYEVCGTSH